VNPYVNEEVMWQRLRDAQREAETRRLMGNSSTFLSLARTLARRLWMRIRPAPRTTQPMRTDDRPSVSDVA
jgi:hypothetical protein